MITRVGMLFTCLLVSSTIITAVVGTFNTNLVSSWNYNGDCVTDDGWYTTEDIQWLFDDHYCTMSQIIDVTLARNYLLRPGGRVDMQIALTAKGASGSNPGTFQFVQHKCIGGQEAPNGRVLWRFTSDGTTSLSASMRLQPNVCSMYVELFFNKTDPDRQKAQVNPSSIAVILSSRPATNTAELTPSAATITQQLTKSMTLTSDDTRTLHTPTLSTSISGTVTETATVSANTVTNELTATTSTTSSMWITHSLLPTHTTNVSTATRLLDQSRTEYPTSTLTGTEFPTTTLTPNSTNATRLQTSSYSFLSSSTVSPSASLDQTNTPMELSTRSPTTLTKVVQALAWPALISTPVTSTSLARLGLLRMTASSCSGGDADSSTSLVSIRAGATSCATSESPSASGAIGSLVLLVAVCAVAALVAANVTWASSNTNNSEPRLSTTSQIAAGCRRLALPSSLLPAWAAVVPSMSIAIVTLPPMLSCAGDAALLVAVVLLSVGPLMALALLWRFAATELTLHAAPTASPPPLQCSMRYARWLWLFWCEPRYTWQSAGVQQQYGQGVLDDYRRVWYALLEAVLLVVAGIVAGVATQLDEDSCGSLLWLLAAMYVLQLVVCAAARPFMSAMADAYAVVMLLLTATSAVLQTAVIQDVDVVNSLNWCSVVLSVVAVASNVSHRAEAISRDSDG